ncbi:neurotrimin-like isoform X1 [Planococcus citri]|uniref:neurotrimin-like isoform X1 n=1 Tax=Planococcus citri TaxID=170843 RepID=UPI0031F8064A
MLINNLKCFTFLILFIPLFNFGFVLCILFSEIPKFGNLMKNVTVTVGRDTVLTCVVENLSTFKVAWLRVDTQTILTIQNHVITKNHRIAVSNSDQQVWRLHIKDVRIGDRGPYMCQINTDPMKSQTAYIEVVAPPDILDYPTSSDVIIGEGSNVTLQCAADGSPTPLITWRREDGSEIFLDQVPNKAFIVKNDMLTLLRVDWRHSGIYLCIASNGVPPTVSKRISVLVQYAPKIYIRNQLIGSYIGKSLTLECETEAYPKPIYYWTSSNGQLITDGEKYETVFQNNMYRISMKLFIKEVTESSFGVYQCISKNPLGTSEGIIKVYPLEEGWIWKSTIKPHSFINNTVEASISVSQPIFRLNSIILFTGVFISINLFIMKR